MRDSFYTKFCNHWVALLGVGCIFGENIFFFKFKSLTNFKSKYIIFSQALSSILIMFVIQWVYAVANIGVALLLFLYIGKSNPGLPPGDLSFNSDTKSSLSVVLGLAFGGAVQAKSKRLTAE